jgi:hypothetical protein
MKKLEKKKKNLQLHLFTFNHKASTGSALCGRQPEHAFTLATPKANPGAGQLSIKGLVLSFSSKSLQKLSIDAAV